MVYSGKLYSLSCEACRADSQPVDLDLAKQLLLEIPEWELVSQDGVDVLSRQFSFDNFREAFMFATRVADIAEQENHHPLLQVEWGRVTVRWWTHRIDGLHMNDFIMAARTDRLRMP